MIAHIPIPLFALGIVLAKPLTAFRDKDLLLLLLLLPLFFPLCFLQGGGGERE
ncbi:hypothetical protein BDQ94DRAFT_152165 [Aspergillus welwitschiae]|uniref:Uncharacterized protein n=1 Tax=Aspergillus welwitschiae TaxID=1341132 RepID=A0A3F3PN13_9EURO|nr:hypothetical protein BDQ94DRAFT_152165 [Aspergillus welwitschiae]RDH28335.1 hypothetical protein BDQ94DRAFT_152165 [Aspergillus welwitschiae]